MGYVNPLGSRTGRNCPKVNGTLLSAFGQVSFFFGGSHISYITNIYITHFTSTTCWINAAMIILDFNSHVNDVLFMGGSCLEGSGHKLGVFSIAWDLRDPAASSTFRLIWFLKMTVEAGNCFMYEICVLLFDSCPRDACTSTFPFPCRGHWDATTVYDQSVSIFV